MHALLGKWVPPNERSHFATTFMGSALGSAVFLPFFGFLISITTWELIYHICGIVGIIWFFFWQRYAFDSPDEHPTIDPGEREYIKNALGTSVQAKKSSVRIYKCIYRLLLHINIYDKWFM